MWRHLSPLCLLCRPVAPAGQTLRRVYVCLVPGIHLRWPDGASVRSAQLRGEVDVVEIKLFELGVFNLFIYLLYFFYIQEKRVFVSGNLSLYKKEH